MKQLHSIKNLFVAALIGATSAVSAQTSHPLAFDSSASTGGYNWYKNYVGLRLEVTKPSSVAGDKLYTTAGGPGGWGGTVTTPMVNYPVVLVYPDSAGCSPITIPPYASGTWIALVWRGPIGTPCEFGAKALAAQTAGAAACVIINEYAGEGPVGMGPGASGASVTIPVFMIGNLDGIAISNACRAATTSADSVRMTITPWGQGLVNDLGFVPGGYSIWHDYAIPYWQLNGSTASPYKGINGAFVANYGSAGTTNVKLATQTSFTPNGGSTSVLHSDTTTLASFPAVDSIWAFFGPQYNLPAITGAGRYDISYNISSSAVDQFPGDNTYTYSYYATDSLFSKTRFDFANNHLIVNEWFRTNTNFLWGVPYYINQGGFNMKNLQFSISGANSAGTADPLPAGNPINFYIFKWTGGTHDTDYVHEQQLQLVGGATKSFNGITDSSFQYYTVSPIVIDTVNFTAGSGAVTLASNSWYIIAADVPYDGSTQYYLGIDGVLDAYPREYGRGHFNNTVETFNAVVDTGEAAFRSVLAAGNYVMIPYPGGSAGSIAIDSVLYHSQIGVIPAIAFNVPTIADTTHTPPDTTSNAGVHGIGSPNDRFELYPNPASNEVTVALIMGEPVSTVTYTIMNAMGRIVHSEIKHNVAKDEKYTYSTTSLPAGNYFMVLNADGRQMYKKFTVARE